MLEKCLINVRKSEPLIHNITNYVTVNDVANILLACGARPIMADDANEVSDITSICDGLNINIGTLNEKSIKSMIIAGKRSNKLGHCIVFDPVGAGASEFRTNTAIELIDKIKFDVIKGNISEIKNIVFRSNTINGVDANTNDKVTEQNLEDMIELVKNLANKKEVIIVATGAIDLVSDGKKCYVIRNGRPEMSKVTGTGCQLSAIIAAYVAANPDNKFEAVATAVCLMGLAGEIAYANMQKKDGNSTYCNRIIDAVYNIDSKILSKGAKYEIR